ncbi:hypothetical protein JHK85_042459 [Glycine max]|nr:hypothetical protein JHK86_041848 [Glycine max]KAG4956079.1 hypothetical protein JHK85_042459 [Glycine max]
MATSNGFVDGTPSESALIFLGTGCSSMVPNLMCLLQPSDPPCPVCVQSLSIPPERNPNYRCNTSLLIDYGAAAANGGDRKYILIDVGKTFRETVLRWFVAHRIPRIDSIILTHEHADAVLGLDDIRAVQAFSPTNDIDPTPIYLSQHSMDSKLTQKEEVVPLAVMVSQLKLRRLSIDQYGSLIFNMDDVIQWLNSCFDLCNSIAEKFPYLVQKKRKEGAEIRRVAQIDWNIIADDCNQQFFASGLKFTPLPVMHGEDYICLGFLFGEKNRVAYISDVSRFPASTEYVISKSGAGQLDLLILDSLYRTGSHNVHLCFPQTLETVKRLCPKQTLLIGMTHEFDHHKDNEFLMEWSRREGIPVKLAHDGLRVKACDNVYRILLILIRLDWSINILYRISSISAVVKSHIFARGRISGYEKRITYFDGNPNSSY